MSDDPHAPSDDDQSIFIGDDSEVDWARPRRPADKKESDSSEGSQEQAEGPDADSIQTTAPAGTTDADSIQTAGAGIAADADTVQTSGPTDGTVDADTVQTSGPSADPETAQTLAARRQDETVRTQLSNPVLPEDRADAATVDMPGPGEDAATLDMPSPTGDDAATLDMPDGPGATPTTDRTQLAVASDSTAKRSAVGSGSGVLSADGSINQRLRDNQSLDEHTRDLDHSLQRSRRSVFVDMVSQRADHIGSQVIRQRLSAQDTVGRYTVARPLGEGGMGAVLEIEDIDFHRSVAMKIIKNRSGQPLPEEVVGRFLEEAQVTAQLEHPNIVPLHDLGVIGGDTIYYTMKLIEGESLGQVVKKLQAGDRATTERWTEEYIILNFLKVLDGLGYAHEKGVVHRDIKPDNIMIERHGEVLVVDWGLAKILGQAERRVDSIRQSNELHETLDGSVMGTLFYMPPEQADGRLEEIDGRADIFALGATLYELLSRQRAYESGDRLEVLRRVAEGQWRPLDQTAPQLHADLVAIVHRAMAADRLKRYGDCAAFAADLRAYLAGQAVAARRRSLLERAGAWLSAHRVPVLTGLAIVIIAVGSAIVAMRMQAEQLAAKQRQQAEPLIATAQQALHADADRSLATTDDRILTKRISELSTARDAAIEARSLLPSEPGLDELLAGLSRRLGELEQRRDSLAAERANAERAAELLAAGLQQEGDGELAAAADSFRAALRLQHSQAAHDALLRVDRILQEQQRDARRAAQLEEVRAARDRLDGLLGQLRELSADDAAMDPLLEQATAELVAAQRYEDQLIVPDGLIEAAEQLAQERRRRAAALASATARQQALAQAETAWQQAQAARTRLQQSQQALTAAANDVRRLQDELAQASGEQKAPLWAAHRRRRAEQAASITAWNDTEAAAQQVLAVLDEQADHPLARQAAQLLAELNHQRLQAAVADNDAGDIAAYRRLVARYDRAGTYAPVLDARSDLSVTGPAGTKLAIHELVVGDDTRLQPGTELFSAELPLDAPRSLPVGRYQVRVGEQRAAVDLDAGEAQELHIRTDAPDLQLPGGQSIDCRFVPTTAGGYWLGTYEITHRQWMAFVTAPEQWQAIEIAALKNVDKQGRYPYPYIPVPRSEDDLGVRWPELTIDAATGRPSGYTLPKAVTDHPVAGIDRSDAEAFCAWLSTSSGRQVRLPAAKEWQYAATADDNRRTYPWGPIFDQSFTVAFDRQRAGSAAVGSVAADTGPFGHRDLAGNVREWLGDRRGPAVGMHEAAIAGGAWTDSDPEQFAGDSTEPVFAAAVNAAIGFRILVEIQP